MTNRIATITKTKVSSKMALIVVGAVVILGGAFVTYKILATGLVFGGDNEQTTSYSEIDPIPGLISFWSFDQDPDYSIDGRTIMDSVDSNHGRQFNTQKVNAVIGLGLKFNSNDKSYVKISDNNNLDFSGDFAISLWVKRGARSGENGLVTKWAELGNTNQYINERSYSLTIDKDNKFRLSINENGRSSGLRYVISDKPMVNGKWYHVAGVNKNKTLSLFVNGIEQESRVVFSGNIYQGKADLILGASNTGNRARFTGILDEVKIYGEAPSIEQIRANGGCETLRGEYCVCGNVIGSECIDPNKLVECKNNYQSGQADLSSFLGCTQVFNEYVNANGGCENLPGEYCGCGSVVGVECDDPNKLVECKNNYQSGQADLSGFLGCTQVFNNYVNNSGGCENLHGSYCVCGSVIGVECDDPAKYQECQNNYQNGQATLQQFMGCSQVYNESQQ